jgi:hypothetical protein
MLFPPGVENAFTGALARGIEILGPWSTHFMVPMLLAIEDPRERERALSSYIEPIAEKIRTQRPDAIWFSPTPQALGDTTLHDVFVTRHGVFPARGYRRTEVAGWVVYELTEEDAAVRPPGRE